MRGNSGRVVIEIDPNLKDDLYQELARRELTLKAWFVEAVETLLDGAQPHLLGLHAEDAGLRATQESSHLAGGRTRGDE